MEENTVLNRIRELCADRNWSIYKLAQKSSIPYSSLNNIFVRNTSPTVPTIEKICFGFGISMSDFFSQELPSTHYEILDTPEKKFLEQFRSLSPREKKLLESYLDLLCGKDGEQVSGTL